MSTTTVAALGVIQGATEFLPVSSSGHLRLAELAVGGMPASLALEVALHVGTLGAVVLYYRRDLFELVRGVLPGGDPEARALATQVVIASIPTALIGLGLKKAGVEHLGGFAVGLGLLWTSAANFSTAHSGGGQQTLDPVRAFVLGVVQGLAVLPGVSRSGSTIAAAMALGIPGKEAARFSFLCSVPAVAGAALLTAKDMVEAMSGDGAASLDLTAVLTGMALAFAVGYACLAFLIRQIDGGSFRLWGFYTLALGLAVLALTWSP